MGSPYIGEIRMFGGSFAPVGWAFCNGAAQDISQNPTMFQLIGTTYGGDGQQTFNLPDLQGRVPVHQGTLPGTGTTFPIGQSGGTETVTLTQQQMPAHTHALSASGNYGTQPQPANAYPSAISSGYLYTTFSPGGQMNAASVSSTGGGQPHDNIMPSLVISYIISLYGIYPSQT
jgi:microcystin-dependent protein